MINMMKADFYRIFRGMAIYVGIFIMLLMSGISVFNIQPGYIGLVGSERSRIFENSNYEEVMSEITADEMKSMSLLDYRNLMMKVSGYKLDQAILGTNVNLYYIFIFAAALAVTVDFSGSSVKNTLSSAIGRKKYYASKVLFVNLMCAALLAANTLFVYFFNVIFNGRQFASDFSFAAKITLMQLPAVMALAAILTGIAFMVRRTVVYNTVTIPLLMIFQIILSLLSALFSVKEDYFEYELQMMISNLAYNPSGSYVVHAYLLCGGLMALFYSAGWLSFRKAEIR